MYLFRPDTIVTLRQLIACLKKQFYSHYENRHVVVAEIHCPDLLEAATLMI